MPSCCGGPAFSEAMLGRCYGVRVSGGAGGGDFCPSDPDPTWLRAVSPPMAPRFIDSSADDGTTITVDRPARMVSYNMFMPRRWSAVGCDRYSSPAWANCLATRISP